jgi:hypothetical protein
LFELPQIEHMIADRDTDARGQTVLGGEHPVREILDRKVGGGVDWDEGAEGGIVGVGHKSYSDQNVVMAGLVPAIYVFLPC